MSKSLSLLIEGNIGQQIDSMEAPTIHQIQHPYTQIKWTPTLPMVLPSCSVQESCCPRLISHRSPPRKENQQQVFNSVNSVFKHPCFITYLLYNYIYIYVLFTSKVATYHARSYYSSYLLAQTQQYMNEPEHFSPQKLATQAYKRSKTNILQREATALSWRRLVEYPLVLAGAIWISAAKLAVGMAIHWRQDGATTFLRLMEVANHVYSSEKAWGSLWISGSIRQTWSRIHRISPNSKT